jgi:hypothetical protein
MTQQEVEEFILALAKENKNRENLKIAGTNFDLYRDDHFVIYQAGTNELIIYNRDIDKALFFDLEVINEGISDEDGYLQDGVDDLILRLNGEVLTIFDGRYL